ncbi:MAG: hypothetical protein ABI690_27320 [Chloroflexota bacterium]
MILVDDTPRWWQAYKLLKLVLELALDDLQTAAATVSLSPIFGNVHEIINPTLAFVLIPFREQFAPVLTVINDEVKNQGLICKRGDDFKTINAVIDDIWKAICEARVIIADMTGLNPNVAYEVGMAHTIGKDTILIYQQQKGKKFPFDLHHIRRIEYADTPDGLIKLSRELRGTLTEILK